jgi:Fe2+ or Zn2+ uptake regulation protein
MNKHEVIFPENNMHKQMQLQIDFYNTINLPAEELKKAKESNNLQNKRVLQIYIEQKTAKTPLQVHEIYEKQFCPNTPFTSIRRAINNLTKLGILQKTEKMIMERYNKPNHLWQINPNLLYENI